MAVQAAAHTLSLSPSRCSAHAQELDEDGGVQKLAAGGTFTLCLTRKGRAGLLGRMPGAPAFLAAPDGSALTDCAAGHAHAVLTDGARVWTTGRWVSSPFLQCSSSPDWP